MALTNLRGEPGRHALSLDLQVPLLLELALEEVNPLLGIGALLVSHVTLRAEPLHSPKQIILLLLYSLRLHGVHARPLNQSCELLLGLMSMLASIRLPNSKVGQLPAGRGKLSHHLTCGSELLGQPLMQLRLFSKASQMSFSR